MTTPRETAAAAPKWRLTQSEKERERKRERGGKGQCARALARRTPASPVSAPSLFASSSRRHSPPPRVQESLSRPRPTPAAQKDSRQAPHRLSTANATESDRGCRFRSAPPPPRPSSLAAANAPRAGCRRDDTATPPGLRHHRLRRNPPPVSLRRMPAARRFSATRRQAAQRRVVTAQRRRGAQQTRVTMVTAAIDPPRLGAAVFRRTRRMHAISLCCLLPLPNPTFVPPRFAHQCPVAQQQSLVA